MNKSVVIIPLVLIVFLSGCVKPETTEVLFRDDAVTIENLIVDTVAPYSETTVNIEFDVQSNADRIVPKITVNFFDMPGFTPKLLNCKTEIKGPPWKCEYTQMESLDSNHISIKLEALKIESPTPFTVSFSVNYKYDGKKEALIPVINPLIRKEPLFKFSQSEPTVGPILFEIQPLLEREKIVNDKIIKEYWAIKGNEFTTKFVLKDVGTIKNVLPVNIPAENVEFSLTNLKVGSKCENFDANGKSNRYVDKTFNTLICSFIPDAGQAEFTGIIRLSYNYNYEFIRSVNFVVQPSVR